MLVYSGRLLVPTARLRPEDIIATAYFPTGESAYTLRPEDVPFPIFPEDDIALKIREVLDGKIGFDLLVYGTIGSVLTVIAGAVGLSWNAPLALEVASPPATGAPVPSQWPAT